MPKYSRLNLIFGWISFLVASVVYISTVEPTASFWDCGEFIAASNKLLVGHPPGAPFFLLLGRFFTLFAADVSQVAITINIMSALASAFTILFLFWSITHLGHRIFISKQENPEPWRILAVLSAGMVGALAYTFSDTFWFSAVEGEVYAMSSLFTALVFWAILKWEHVAHEPHSNRWLILIAYLMGLSIGVHLLNLLAIPAIVMVYYFKKYEVNRNNTIKALIIAGLLLISILYIIIPGVVKIASWFELLFVNNFGLPFNSGVVVYAILLIGGLCYGIYYTYTKNKPIMNTILTGIAVILMGYSSFATVVIRSAANPTMDQNSPEDVFSLQYYLNREQYGDRPLFSGQYYNSPLDWNKMDGDKGKPIYAKKDKKYEIVDYRPTYKFDSKTTTLFPRMYSREDRHIEAYKHWGNIKGKNVVVEDYRTGQPSSVKLPKFIENVKFFINYQVNFMYFRYFMWNFSGRQNDIQSHGEIHHGNWITGISFIDNYMYGDQSKLPDYLKENRGNNKYYMLPLLLGIIGLLFQLGAGREGKRDFWVVMLLFFFTGLAIVIYLNQTPYQPRERDYAYAGSFYAFAIWIGLGVLGIVEILRKVFKGNIATPLAAALTLVFVPGLMATENWDDHDRSHRTIARDLGYNYLNTVGENGVIFTNGDNDTFPLWYIQEVEGVRTDVRVCNLSYLQTDWYIDQMKRKAYDSEPLPFSFERKQYETGTNDVVHLFNRVEGVVDLREAIKFLKSTDPRTKQIPGYSGTIEHLPAKQFYLPIDAEVVIKNKVVSENNYDMIDSLLYFDLNKERILKNELMVLDLIAESNWERPIYYAVTVGSENYAGLEDYFQLEGFGYRVTPVSHSSNDGQYGHVDTDRMYENVTQKFLFNGWNDDRVYLDENHQRMGINIRNNLTRLATALIEEGDKERALEILDFTMEKLPPSRIPHNYFSLFIAEGYYEIEEFDKGDEVIMGLAELNRQELDFFTHNPRLRNYGLQEIQRNMAIYQEIFKTLTNFSRKEIADEIDQKYDVIFHRLGLYE